MLRLWHRRLRPQQRGGQGTDVEDERDYAQEERLLEGTYAVHGIEEIMRPDEVVVVIDPFAAEIEKFKTTLVDGVGMTVIAVAAEERRFRRSAFRRVEGTRRRCNCWPDGTSSSRWEWRWGSTLTRSVRARKIGNEFITA